MVFAFVFTIVLLISIMIAYLITHNRRRIWLENYTRQLEWQNIQWHDWYWNNYYKGNQMHKRDPNQPNVIPLSTHKGKQRLDETNQILREMGKLRPKSETEENDNEPK